MKVFDIGEIFQIAVQIEENGEKFYRYAAQLTDDANLKSTFIMLAEDEVKHKKTFWEMCDKKCQYEPFESYPGEYQQYVEAYTADIIFNIGNFEKDMSSVKDPVSAFDFAIRRELDSILFYHEIKKFVKGDEKLIDSIIDEERRHFVYLTAEQAEEFLNHCYSQVDDLRLKIQALEKGGYHGKVLQWHTGQ